MLVEILIVYLIYLSISAKILLDSERESSLFLNIFFFFFFKNNFYFGCARSSLAAHRLPLFCCEQGLLCSCGVWVSHSGGFSCSTAWALGTPSSVLVVPQF